MIPKPTILLLAIVLTLLLISSAPAEFQTNDLQPEGGIFGFAPEPYYLTLQDILLGEHEHRLCQTLAIPSFRAEWAVYLVRQNKTKGEAQVIYKGMKIKLWAKMFEEIEKNSEDGSVPLTASYQEKALAVIEKPVFTASAPIYEETTVLLEQVWNEMLARVHYPKPYEQKSGFDGETYHFSQFQTGLGFRSGTVWSPKEGTNTAALVRLADSLRWYATAEDKDRSKSEVSIRNGAKSLLEKLKEEVVSP